MKVWALAIEGLAQNLTGKHFMSFFKPAMDAKGELEASSNSEKGAYDTLSTYV